MTTAILTNPVKYSDDKLNSANVIQVESAPSSSSFSDIIKRFVMTRPVDSPAIVIENNNENTNITNYKEQEVDHLRSYDRALESLKQQAKLMSKFDTMNIMLKQNDPVQSTPQTPISTTQPVQTTSWPKRTCGLPSLPLRFGKQCHCGHPERNGLFKSKDTSLRVLPPVAYSTPLHLYDPISRDCLPTSRDRDMLLKECHFKHSHNLNSSAHNHSSNGTSSKGSCYYDDLICDPRKKRCVCKPTLHLFYENNLSSFGCVPIGPRSSPDGKILCKSGSIYNVITKDCHKIFDVNDLQSGVSATEFSFVTIIFIWILLLILIVFAKLRKLRASNLYRNTPQSERRLHHGAGVSNGTGSSYRANRLVWLYPFPASRHHQHRTPVDRFSQTVIVDESGNYNDTDFFLANGGNRRMNDLISENNFTGSQQSLNNPPPKFEEIYPGCTPVTTTVDETDNIRPPSNQDLPSYDEAMKLQNTMPPDFSKE